MGFLPLCNLVTSCIGHMENIASKGWRISIYSLLPKEHMVLLYAHISYYHHQFHQQHTGKLWSSQCHIQIFKNWNLHLKAQLLSLATNTKFSCSDRSISFTLEEIPVKYPKLNKHNLSVVLSIKTVFMNQVISLACSSNKFFFRS